MNAGVWVGLAIALLGVAGMVFLAIQRQRMQSRFDQNRAVAAAQAKELSVESGRQSAALERIATALETLVADQKQPHP
jgi:hypothetical protein